MDTILVPNIAPGCRERIVFDKVELFTRLAGNLVKLSKDGIVKPSQIQDIKNSLDKDQKYQALPGIRTLFDSLKQAVLSYEVPRQDSSPEMFEEILFPRAHLRKWTADIACLKSLLTNYGKTMKILHKKQEACWRAKAKVDKYELMLETAQKALRFNPMDFAKRRESVLSLHVALKERVSEYQKCTSNYRDNLTKEGQLRQQIIKEDCRLLQDIKDRVSETIKEGLFHLTKICCPLVLPEVDSNAVAAEICSLNATQYNLIVPMRPTKHFIRPSYGGYLTKPRKCLVEQDIQAGDLLPDCSVFPQFGSRLSLPCKLLSQCSTIVDNKNKKTTTAALNTTGTSVKQGLSGNKGLKSFAQSCLSKISRNRRGMSSDVIACA